MKKLRLIALATAVVGGLLWVLRWLTDGSGTSDGLYWAGLVVLAVALGCLGAGLVSRSATPLRVLVAVAVPLLAWSLASVVRPAGPAVVDGLLGLAALVAGVVGLVRARQVRPAPRRRADRRAA
jgi:hypothetical protein